MVQAYSIGQSRRETSGNKNNAPGPGAYDDTQGQKVVHESSPEWSFAKSGRRGLSNEGSPGPGAYEHIDGVGHGTSYTMGQRSQQHSPFRQGRDPNPGPGSYDLKDQSKTPQYTMGGKRKDLKDQNIPGPGSYNQTSCFDGDKSKNKSQAGFGSNQQRSNNHQHSKTTLTSPGPGKYAPNVELQKYKNPTYSFSKGQKGISHRDLSPGPGAYNEGEHKSIAKSGKKVTMGSRPKTAKVVQTPGPGHYTRDDGLLSSSKSKNYSVMKSKQPRMAQMSKDILSSPGPGAYDPNETLTRDKSPNPHFGQTKRNNFVGNEQASKPGPGAYDVQSAKNGPSFTMRSKVNNGNNNKNPGPGNYEPNINATKDSIRTFKMGSPTKDRGVFNSKSHSQLPGPGEYHADQEFGKNAPKFTMKGKPSDTNRNNSPGPCAYSPSNELCKDKVPTYTIGGSRRKTDLSQTIDAPGPGSYTKEERFGHGAPSYTIGGKRQQNDNTLSPGPAYYDVQDGLTKCLTPSYRQSSSKRADLVSKSQMELPGPGSYQDDNKNIGKGGPSYTIGAKINRDDRSFSPGPAAYEPNNNYNKDSVRTFKMGSAKRSELVGKQAKELPGPGNYTVEYNSHKPQSFTIQGKRETKVDTLSPGPGAYNASTNAVKDKTPSYKMSTSKRAGLVSKDAKSKPGPGSYSTHKEIGKNMNKMSILGKPKEINKNLNPGPGEYDPSAQQIKDRVISHKMSKSTRGEIVPKTAREMPGPGSYESPLRIGKDAPAYSMKSKRDEQRTEKTPGPGTYDLKDTQNRPKTPSYKMGTSHRADILNKTVAELPGPGCYSQADLFGKTGPSFTIKAKNGSRIKNEVPGPGNYEPTTTLVKDKTISYKMGQSQRADLITKDAKTMPGPGTYTNSHKEIGKDVKSFTIQGKREERIDTLSPGPGGYDPQFSQNKDRVISYRMGNGQRAEMVSKSISELPGPGCYDSPSKLGKEGPQYTMGTKSPTRNETVSPGPAAYSPSNSLIKDRSVCYGLGKSERPDLVSKSVKQLPGPGIYDQKSSIGQGPSFTIKQKPNERVGNDNPGPGNYEPASSVVKDRVISHKMSKSERADLVSKDAKNLPGPGNYASHDDFGKDAKSFKIRGRPEEVQRNDSPGPGEYEPSYNQVKDKAIAYNLGKGQRADIISKEMTNRPGPGTYESPSRIGQGNGFTIGGKAKDVVDNNKPGPGAYDPKDFLTKDKVPTASMSKSNRASLVSKNVKDTPGPGNYISHGDFGKDGKSVTIRGKPQDVAHNDTPGPGEYEPKDSQSRYQSPSYKISQSNRSEMLSPEKKCMPGPGIYDQPSSFGKGPSFQIRGKPNPEKDNANPGPGAYDARHGVTKDKIPTVSLGKSKRDFLTIQDEKPGPGNYDYQLKSNAPSYSIRGKPVDNQGNGFPGPGTYSPDGSVIKDRNPSANFSRSPDRSRQSRSGSPMKDPNPGPGAYDARDYNLSGYTSIAYTIPKDESPERDNGYPGPGHYKIPVKFADVPRYILPNQNEEFKYV